MHKTSTLPLLPSGYSTLPSRRARRARHNLRLAAPRQSTIAFLQSFARAFYPGTATCPVELILN